MVLCVKRKSVGFVFVGKVYYGDGYLSDVARAFRFEEKKMVIIHKIADISVKDAKNTLILKKIVGSDKRKRPILRKIRSPKINYFIHV